MKIPRKLLIAILIIASISTLFSEILSSNQVKNNIELVSSHTKRILKNQKNDYEQLEEQAGYFFYITHINVIISHAEITAIGKELINYIEGVQKKELPEHQINMSFINQQFERVVQKRRAFIRKHIHIPQTDPS